MGKYEEASGGRHFDFSEKAGKFLPDSDIFYPSH